MRRNWLAVAVCFLLAAIPSFAQKRKHAKTRKKPSRVSAHFSARSSRISYRMPIAVVPQENRGWMYATEISSLGRPRPRVDYSQAANWKLQSLSATPADADDGADGADTDLSSMGTGSPNYGIAQDLALVQRLRIAAEPYLGIPYKGRRRNSGGYDCSGFVRAILGDFGVTLAGSSSQDFFQLGTPIKPEELQPGDLVFFSDNSRRLGHVGIYVDSGVFVHSALRSGITYSRMDDAWYHRRYQGARRISSIVAGLQTKPILRGSETALGKSSASEASN
jgi:cell wall-associated NlpC family hydrolase